MPHHRSVKAALIAVAVASLLCITLAYVAAYQATARAQGPIRMRTIGEVQTNNLFGPETKVGLYLLQCSHDDPGYIGLLLIDEMNPWPLDSYGFRVPTAPPCP